MIKLGQEELEFIDNYLKNSGVEYIDVRLEMLDHVASAVEAKMKEKQTDFYETFKAYMVMNKKELLKQTDSFAKESLKKVLQMVGKNLFHPLSLVITAAVVIITVVLFDFLKQHLILFSLGLFFLEFVAIVLITKTYKKQKYLHLQKLVSIIMSFDYIMHMYVLEREIPYYEWILALFILINISFFLSLYQLFNEYKKQFDLV
ncbi:hypothetical protein LX95_00567 [Mesonia algae]|uniref:Uncharacterized protein n=1 Tax=Mesonia algae TaxID=213248 RepID=A0A2W7IZV5_9FLAO|nr:hypothetical protein [Mesonia algae]PZW44233.1 hypothetical protein LX95_00567 [Mesonia algae]